MHPAEIVEAILGVRPPPDELVMIDGDTVMSAGSAEAALRAAGAAVAAVDAVCGGTVDNAFAAVRPPGHHATPTVPGGFCLFNNVVIAARHAQATYGIKRLAIVDFDVHHGNGTQAVAEIDSSLFFGSTHQYPFYPGTGSARERGIDGNVVNVPLAAGSGSEQFRMAWADRILPALDTFAPRADHRLGRLRRPSPRSAGAASARNRGLTPGSAGKSWRWPTSIPAASWCRRWRAATTSRRWPLRLLRMCRC